MRRDQGFTVAEMVIAAAILFIVLTGLFGLVGASTQTSVSAKLRSVAVDSAGSYIEEVRAMPYAQVGTPSGTPTGTLVPTTVTKAGMTVVVTPVVAWVPDPKLTNDRDYKKVSLTVLVSKPGLRTYTYTVSTYVRNPSTNPGNAGGGTVGRPTISFTMDTPAEGVPIWGTTQIGVGAIASHQASDGVLTVMRIIGGNGLVMSSDLTRAEWAINAHDFTSTPNPFRWDTTLSYQDTSTVPATTKYYYPDGPITLIAEVLDTRTDRAFVVRHYIVDNNPPDPPSNLVVTPPSTQATPFRLEWTPGTDGSSLAPQHRIVAYRQNSTSTDMTSWAAQAPVTVATPAGSPSRMSYDYTGGAFFSRYAFSVVALSPRPTASTAVVSAPSTSRPKVSGTSATSGSSETHTLSITPPTFPCVVEPTYQWYVSFNGTWSTSPVGTTTLPTLSRTAPDKNGIYRYRVRVTYTPSDPGSTSTYAYSQICGQTDKNDSDFTRVDDWGQWW